jgi:hypothetical protein
MGTLVLGQTAELSDDLSAKLVFLFLSVSAGVGLFADLLFQFHDLSSRSGHEGVSLLEHDFRGG